MEAQDQVRDVSVPRMWDRSECASQIGVSVRTLDRMVADGKIPVLRMRSKVLFRPESILKWMDESENKPK
jgi:excisionase family DNA binding protein